MIFESVRLSLVLSMSRQAAATVVPNCGMGPLENLKPAGVQNVVKTIPASSQDHSHAP